MRFIIMVKATGNSEGGVFPDAATTCALHAYHEALAQAGVLLDASEFKPSAEGWRVLYNNATRTVVNGPFADPESLIAGYTLIQVRSREEAMEWARRFPPPACTDQRGEIEVRQLCGFDETIG